MISFVSQPKDFTPIQSGVVYTIESDEPTDFDIGIIDNDTGIEVGRKHIYNTTTAVVDISPYIANLSEQLFPKASPSELRKAPTATYILTVDTSNLDSEVSDTVTVSNNPQPLVLGVESIFPKSMLRKLSIGDSDELRVTTLPKSILTVEVTTDQSEHLSFELYSSNGIAIFHLSSGDFADSTKEITVDIYRDENLLQSVIYDVVPRNNSAMRLMWLTPTGVVEHYTFPVTESKSIVAEQRQLFLGTSGTHIGCSALCRATLRSDIHTSATIEALSTIIISPKVWIENQGNFYEATVVNTSAETSKLGKPTTLSVTIEYNRKEVRL